MSRCRPNPEAKSRQLVACWRIYWIGIAGKTRLNGGSFFGSENYRMRSCFMRKRQYRVYDGRGESEWKASFRLIDTALTRKRWNFEPTRPFIIAETESVQLLILIC